MILLWRERRHPVCKFLFQHSRSCSGFSGKVSNKQISNIVMLTILLVPVKSRDTVLPEDSVEAVFREFVLVLGLMP